MILTARKDALLGACQLLQTVTPSKGAMPIYANAKAVATADRLTLMATDLEVGLRYDLLGLAVEEPGEAILPLSRLTAILRESPDDEVKLDADARRVVVTTASSDYELPGDDPSAFADVADFAAGERTHELEAGQLGRMIRRTAFAVATDEGKYAMRGVLWDLDGTSARLVGTDGKRIALATGRCVTDGEDAGDGRKPSHLVPAKAMRLLAQLLGQGDAGQPVRVRLGENDALFKTERAVIYSRLVEGRFPPWSDVIPKNPKTKVPLVAGQFLSAIRQAAVMTSEESKRIGFKFEPGRVTLKAAGATTGKGEVRAGLPAEGWSGPAVETAFEAAYLTEYLRLRDAAEVLQLDFVDGKKSAVFRDGGNDLYLVVPLI